MKISVVYITNGLNLNTLNKCLDSAKFADEIIVVGDTETINRDCVKIERKDLAGNGLISKMRNIGADVATGDIIINADDDIFFPTAFKAKLLRFIKANPNIESFNTKVIGINGSRYWDRAVHASNGNSYMIDYADIHEDLYYSGAFIIRKKVFAKKYKWNDNLGYYQKEDVEYSNRIKQSGYAISVDPKNYVVHMDANYIAYRNGDGRLVCGKMTHTNVMCDEIQEKEFREIKEICKNL